MRYLSLLFCPLLALNTVWAQASAVGAAAEPAFHVHVVDDPGAAATQSTSAKGYVVQVTEVAGVPVAGAAVALRLPEDGPTGRFPNGLRAWVTYSDPAGIARFPVIHWGGNAGRAEIAVTAAKDTRHSGLLIVQQIGPEHPSVSVIPVPVAVAVAKPAALPQPGTLSKAPPDTISKNVPAVSEPTLSGQPMVLAPLNISRSGSSAPDGESHSLTPDPPPPVSHEAKEPTPEPAVSITNSAANAGGLHESHGKRWLLLGAVGAGAAVAAVVLLKGHATASSSGSSSGVSIGAPTISVGSGH
jgi:hypothetical protein